MATETEASCSGLSSCQEDAASCRRLVTRYQPWAAAPATARPHRSRRRWLVARQQPRPAERAAAARAAAARAAAAAAAGVNCQRTVDGRCRQRDRGAAGGAARPGGWHRPSVAPSTLISGHRFCHPLTGTPVFASWTSHRPGTSRRFSRTRGRHVRCSSSAGCGQCQPQPTLPICRLLLPLKSLRRSGWGDGASRLTAAGSGRQHATLAVVPRAASATATQ